MTITAELDGAKAEKAYTVVANPVAVLDLAIAEETIRTGDVIKLVGAARRSDGAAVTDAPITWSYTYTAPEGNTPKAPGGAGIIDNGLFVANYPGMYTILAASGSANARKTLEVTPRDVRRRIIDRRPRQDLRHAHVGSRGPTPARTAGTTASSARGAATATRMSSTSPTSRTSSRRTR